MDSNQLEALAHIDTTDIAEGLQAVAYQIRCLADDVNRLNNYLEPYIEQLLKEKRENH